MRIGARISELGGNPVLQTLGNEMLQPFRFFVHLVPGVVQELVQEAFQEPVMAQHFESAPPSGGAQPHATMLFVKDVRRPLRGQLLQHPRNGGGADAQMRRQGIARNALTGGTAQLEDGFQIVVDRFGSGRRRSRSGRH